MTNKRYPDEFKREAVRQITDRGHSVADLSKRLDVSTHSLYVWVKKFGPDAEANQSRNDSDAQRMMQQRLKAHTTCSSAVTLKTHNSLRRRLIRWTTLSTRISGGLSTSAETT